MALRKPQGVLGRQRHSLQFPHCHAGQAVEAHRGSFHPTLDIADAGPFFGYVPQRLDELAAAADLILSDTRTNVILGRGDFSYKNEPLDLAVPADAKTFSLLSGQLPAGVGGWVARLSINPIRGDSAGRAGISLCLAGIATPVAGLLAFVDLGESKVAACGPVLSRARESEPQASGGEKR